MHNKVVRIRGLTYAPLVPSGAVDITEESSLLPIGERPCNAVSEDGGDRGDAILAVLVLEAVVVVALDVLEKFRALRRCHRAVVLIVGPY